MWLLAKIDGGEIAGIIAGVTTLLTPIFAFLLKRGSTDPIVRALRQQNRSLRKTIASLEREAAEREARHWEATRQHQREIAELRRELAELREEIHNLRSLPSSSS